MKRYFLTNETPESIKETLKMLKNPPKEKDQNGDEIEEDDIVDDSNFVIDKESVRQARLSGGGDGAGQKGLYDNRKISDLEIQLRDGKLDKADITQEQMRLQKEITEKDNQKRQEELEAIRQKAIDNAIGVGQPEQQKPE